MTVMVMVMVIVIVMMVVDDIHVRDFSNSVITLEFDASCRGNI